MRRVFAGVFILGVLSGAALAAFTPGSPASKDELETRLSAVEAAVSTGNPNFLSGSGDPDDALGKNGDHYMNVDNGRFFLRAGGTWEFLGEIWFDTVGVLP